MKIAYLTAGAAGMFCGSCMLDNALAKATIKQGHECLLIPLYTPIRTDEEDISIDQVFFGGINIYLQERLPFLKWLPRWLDAPLNHPAFVKLATRNVGKTSKKLLGQLTLSILDGTAGKLQKEAKHLCHWLSHEIKPDHIILTNLMIGGVMPDFKRDTAAKCWVILQGDDVFLDNLTEPYKSQAIAKMTALVAYVDGFIIHSREYADRMAKLFAIPPEKLHVVPLGIETRDFVASRHQNDDTLAPGTPRFPLRIGYLARMSREKGLHRMVDAFTKVAHDDHLMDSTLHIAGYLGPQNHGFWREQQNKLRDIGADQRYKYYGSVDRKHKLDFLDHVDLLCVPTEYREPKGLFVLEAVAAGTPYLLPNHGAFPEMHERLQYGWLFEAGDLDDLAAKLRTIAANVQRPKRMFADRKRHVELIAEIDIHNMATRTLHVLQSTTSASS